MAFGDDTGLVSTDTVGYNTTDASGKVYLAIGPTFVDVTNTDGEFTLGQALQVGDGYSWEDDHFYVVDPDTCEAVMEVAYVDGIGWYDIMGDQEVGDMTFAIGTGFQTSFTGNSFDVISSGKVHEDGYSVDCDEKVYQFIVNATGRTITWSEMSVEGNYSWEDDHFYVIDPDTCEAVQEIAYVEGIGWYDIMADADVNDQEIPAGGGFQTSFTGNDITINFPAVVTP